VTKVRTSACNIFQPPRSRTWPPNLESASVSQCTIDHCPDPRILRPRDTHLRNMASIASTSSKSTNGQQTRTKGKPEDVEAIPQHASSTSSAQPDEKDAAPEDEVPAIPFSPRHEMLFIFMICMAQFLSLAGLAQSIAPMEIIGRSFGVTSEAALSWYPASFSLTYGTFILPAGRLVSLGYVAMHY
jgi:hypothetical protein